jgi:hypothetical protein
MTSARPSIRQSPNESVPIDRDLKQATAQPSSGYYDPDSAGFVDAVGDEVPLISAIDIQPIEKRELASA